LSEGAALRAVDFRAEALDAATFDAAHYEAELVALFKKKHSLPWRRSSERRHGSGSRARDTAYEPRRPAVVLKAEQSIAESELLLT
jgi:hypothetical protein